MASAEATPSSTTAFEEQTVAWDNASNLPFIGTDASLADKSGFKNTAASIDSDGTNSSNTTIKSMTKSKVFGQSKPLETDLLANIDESELDDILGTAENKEVTKEHGSIDHKIETNDQKQSPVKSTSNENTEKAVLSPNNILEHTINVDNDNTIDSHATNTSVELDAPHSKDLSTVKFHEPSENGPLSLATHLSPTSERNKQILSPQRQTSEELLQVLNSIQTNYPANDDSNKNSTTISNDHNQTNEKDTTKQPVSSDKESISSITAAAAVSNSKSSRDVKPQRTKSIGIKDELEPAINKKSSLKVLGSDKSKKELSKPASTKPGVATGAGTSMTADEMVNAAEAVAMKAKKAAVAVASSSSSSQPKKPPTSPSAQEVKNPRRKSRGNANLPPITAAAGDTTDGTDNNNSYSNKGSANTENNKRKGGLPPIQKRPTPRKKDEDTNPSNAAADDVLGVANAENDEQIGSSKSKGGLRKRPGMLPELGKEKDAFGVNASPVKAAALNKKKELMQQYTKKLSRGGKVSLPPIDGATDEHSLVSQETPGRAPRTNNNNHNNSDNPSTRAPHSSPPFDRNTASGEGNQSDANSQSHTSSPKKKKKPLYLRMIAKAQRFTMEEEKKKQEEYNRQRSLHPKSTPSRAELKEHASKFQEIINSKAEASRQNHIAQIRALKEQRRRQRRRELEGKSDDTNSLASLAGDESLEDNASYSVLMEGDTAADKDTSNTDRTPIKGATKAKLQKDLEKFDHITQVLEEQKKERQRQYKGLMKKAGLVDKEDGKGHEHHDAKHADLTPTKKSKATISMHVVTIGGEEVTAIPPSPRLFNEESNAFHPHLEPHHQNQSHSKLNKAARQSTPHRQQHQDNNEEDQYDADEFASINNNDDNIHNINDGNLQDNSEGFAAPSFSMMDVLDDEAKEVLNHHRHAGEKDSNEGSEGNLHQNENSEEGNGDEVQLMSISLADYTPALNDQPLPETVKVSEGFFDDVLNNNNREMSDDSDDPSNKLKVVTHDEDDDDDDNHTNQSFVLSRVQTSTGTLKTIESETEFRDPSHDNSHGKDEGAEIVSTVPDLSEKEVAYFVANDWIDMLSSTNMSMMDD